MGDDHQRQAVGGQLGDGVQHLAGQLRVKGGGRLVKQQHFGLEGDGAGDGHALLLPAGELVGVKVLAVEHTHLFQHLVGGLIGGGAVHATGGDKALQHILLDGHVAEEVEVLEHIAHLHPQGTNFAVL